MTYLDFDLMTDKQRDDWWNGAEKLIESKKPVDKMRGYELELLLWYYDCITDAWEYESPQSYSEQLLWHEQELAIAELKFEQARRQLNHARRSHDDWKALRKSSE